MMDFVSSRRFFRHQALQSRANEGRPPGVALRPLETL